MTRPYYYFTLLLIILLFNVRYKGSKACDGYLVRIYYVTSCNVVARDVSLHNLSRGSPRPIS